MCSGKIYPFPREGLGFGCKGGSKNVKSGLEEVANGLESRRTARGPTTFRVVPKSNSRGSLLNYFIAILISLKQFCAAA